MATLYEHFSELRTQEWDDTPVAKYYNVEVVKEFRSFDNCFGKPVRQWPGIHKNVYSWVVLANGKLVGMNENPAKGLTFPVIGFKGYL